MKPHHYLGVAALAIATASSWNGASAQSLQPRYEVLTPAPQGDAPASERREHGAKGESRHEPSRQPNALRQMSEEGQSGAEGTHIQRSQQEQKVQHPQNPSNTHGQPSQRVEAPQGSHSAPTKAETNQQPSQRTAQPTMQPQQAAPAVRTGTANSADPGQNTTNHPQAQGNQQPAAMPQRNAAQPQENTNQGNANQNLAGNRTDTEARGSMNLEPRFAGQMRDRLFETRERNAARFDVTIGAVVPGSARLRPLPAEYIETTPMLRGYEYTVVDDDVVLVEPRSKRVVEVLGPAGQGGYAPSQMNNQASSTGAVIGAAQQQQAAAANMPSNGATGLTLSTNQRDALRRDLLNQPQQAKLDINTGAQLPQTIEIAPIPQQSVANIPGLQGLSYFVSNDRVVIVEPQRHIIVDVIQ